METMARDLAEMRRTPLHEEHVAALRQAGREVSFDAGAIIVQAGAPMETFLYVLEGEIEVVDPRTNGRLLQNTLGPTQFMGEIAFLNGGVYALPMRAAQATRAIAVDRAAMLALMARIPELSDIVITVFAARRRAMLEAGRSSLVLAGAEVDRSVRKLESFARRNRIPFRSLALNTPEAVEAARACGAAAGAPFVAFGGGAPLEDPSPRAVARLLGLDLTPDRSDAVDVLIVGGGPAGVASAVYAGAEGLSAVVVEELAIGGQAGASSRIENYMGFPTGISGGDLVWRGEVQAMKFGTRFVMPRRVEALAVEPGRFEASLDCGARIRAKAVVVATGVQYRRLPLDGLRALEGVGVYYAATESEARYCHGAPVVVVGGGNSAGQAAMYLCRSAAHVHVLVRGPSLATSMSSYLRERLEAEPSITIHYQTEIAALHGENALEALTLRHKAEGVDRRLDACAAFIMVGAAPNTAWLPDGVRLDGKGFVLTGASVGRQTPFETSHDGIFAVGDVRGGSVKRVASAVGEGSVVMSRVWDYVNARD